MNRLTIPDVLDDFVLYLRKNPAWGSLHIALDDGNISDSSVQFCIKYAEEHNDVDGIKLGKILLQMTKTQRRKISQVAQNALYV